MACRILSSLQRRQKVLCHQEFAVLYGRQSCRCVGRVLHSTNSLIQCPWFFQPGDRYGYHTSCSFIKLQHEISDFLWFILYWILEEVENKYIETRWTFEPVIKLQYMKLSISYESRLLHQSFKYEYIFINYFSQTRKNDKANELINTRTLHLKFN